jgi:hypothetical protein
MFGLFGMLFIFCMLSLAVSVPDPNTVISDGAKAQLLKAIKRIWDEQDAAFAGKSIAEVKAVTTIGNKGLQGFVEDTFMAGRKREIHTVSRHFIDTFSSEVAHQSNVGPRCLDWSSRYVAQFPACKDVVNYEYADTNLTYSEKHGKKYLIGDLGQYDVDYLNSHPKFDFLIVTQVLEHVPHFWKAMKGLAELTKPGGYVHFTVPFVYRFHPMPGDFWRYTPMGIIHLFESSGYDICKFASNGYRSIQLLSFGLSVNDISVDYLTKTRTYNSLLDWSSDYGMMAQLPGGTGGEKCAAFTAAKFTNEVQVKDLHEMARGYWPKPGLDIN